MSAAFTRESIKPVRDFTTRKTLEVALARIESGALPEATAQDMARQCLDVIARMVDRDAKAEVFHASVKYAGQGERELWERLTFAAPAAQDGGAP